MIKLHIQHTTCYTYSWAVLYSIQHMRLTPREEVNQKVLQWEINAPCKPTPSIDHFGNTIHHISLNEPYRTLTLSAQGEVELSGYENGYLPASSHLLNPLVFAGTTPLTLATAEITEFSSLVRDKKIPFETRMLSLAHAIADRVEYKTGSTTIADTAADAFENGQGVCQDHAHLMLACLRTHGFCARYVSGYRYNEQAPEHTTHAWIDVFNPEKNQWLSVDATHRCFAQESHCRLAVAKDFTGASPVRGIRSGGGKEELKVYVEIERLS